MNDDIETVDETINRLQAEVERLRAQMEHEVEIRTAIEVELREEVERLREFKAAVLSALESEYGPPGPNGMGPPWTDAIWEAL